MHILEKIVGAKQKELDLKKKLIPISELERSPLFERSSISLKKNLTNSASGIIAEHKRRSPSKPLINNSLSVEDVIKGYSNAGVSGISVLTDGQFFGGSLDDLLLARAATETPLLRKEFIIDEYQLYEAKANGADVVLLIAAILTKEQIEQFSRLANTLNLEVLLEVHDEEELKRSLIPDIDMIGVNNRDLKTFQVSIETSKRLAAMIPREYLKVSESGINDPEKILELKDFGYQGFLIGEHFMKTDNPGTSAQIFIKDLIQ